MSRYTITLAKGERTDDEAVIGFDPPLRTFFLQGFETDDDFATPEIWLGTLLEEFPTLESIIEAASMARAITNRPSVIIAHTIPGKGVDFMEYDYRWHGMAPNHEQAREALEKLRTLDGALEVAG